MLFFLAKESSFKTLFHNILNSLIILDDHQIELEMSVKLIGGDEILKSTLRKLNIIDDEEEEDQHEGEHQQGMFEEEEEHQQGMLEEEEEEHQQGMLEEEEEHQQGMLEEEEEEHQQGMLEEEEEEELVIAPG